MEIHQTISAGDKDMVPNFVKICQFATSDIFVLAKEFSSNNFDAYDSAELA